MSGEDSSVVTRFSNPSRFSADGRVVDTQGLRVEVEEAPFYPFNPDEAPLDAAQGLWESYRGMATLGLRAYARCVRLGDDGTQVNPHVQIFVDDVMLGNLNREGFLRQVVNPDLPDEENLKRIKSRVKELRRYVGSGVLTVDGYFLERPKEG